MVILIVEDNPLMRAMLRETVSEFADAIIECADGDEAFAAYQAHQPHWVLMDIQMARVDGITASHQIKTAYPAANICIVTSYDDAQIRRAAVTVGAAAFVLKENLEELRQLLASSFPRNPAERKTI